MITTFFIIFPISPQITITDIFKRQKQQTLTSKTMFKKKKSVPHKQNTQKDFNKTKKIPSGTNVPKNAEDLHLRINKYCDIKQQFSNSKKNISRKTTSRTIKLQSSLRNGLSKQLRKYHLADSKSKSPSNKRRSKSGTKIKLESRSPSNQLKYKSEKRLSLRIGDTLKRVQFYQMLHGQDQTIVYPSASTRQPPKNSFSSISQLQGVNLEEIKKFTSNHLPPSSRLKVDMKSGDSLQQTMAAIAIQRAWRRYRTQKLVNTYANLKYEFQSSEINPSDRFQQLQLSRNESLVMVPSEDFYGDNSVEDVQNISNLQEEEEDLVEMVENIKMQELKKWNQILTMIQKTKEGGEEEKEKLFLFIKMQSEKNKEELMNLTPSKSRQVREDMRAKPKGRDEKEKYFKKPERKVPRKIEEPLPIIIPQPSPEPKHQPEPQFIQSASSSSISQIRQAHHSGQRVKNQTQSQSDTNNYNSKKYIEYLDSDVYPDNSSQSSAIGIKALLGVTTISSKKQEMLLQALYSKPVRLPQSGHRGSLSLGNMSELPKQIPQAARQQSKLRHSTSQKIMKRTFSNLSQHSQPDINIQLIQDEYLQMYPILNDDNDQTNYDGHPPNINKQLQQEQQLANPQQNTLSPKQLRNQLDDLLQNFTHNEREHPQNLSTVDAISYRRQRKQNVQEKADVVSEIIINELSMEFSKQSSRSSTIMSSIKKYSQLMKLKIKRSDGVKRKRGFQTDKKQIQLFLHNLITYILKQQLPALNNLQFSTGPSTLEMLKYMHTVDDSFNDQNDSAQQASIMVIPNRVFDSFWKIKERSIVVEVPSGFNEENTIMFRQNIQFLKSFNKIFYRSLFDAFNQCLDGQRNFGVLGQPFPWKRSPLFPHKLNHKQKIQCLQNCRKKMLTFSTTYCGLMVDTSQLGQSQQNEQYLKQVQEDRLSRMLANDLIQSQVRWYFYDDEEAEILIEIANVIYRELLFEVMEEMIDFQ